MEILATLIGGLVVFVLVSGLTARFLFKPRKPPPDSAELRQQVSVLAERQEALEAELHSLREAQEFQARLLEASQDSTTDD